jgi:hypothetical protein
LKDLECCWCSTAADVGYLALRSMVGCVNAFSQDQARGSYYEVGDVVRCEGKCPYNTKTMVEMIKVCPNAGRTTGQIQQ